MQMDRERALRNLGIAYAVTGIVFLGLDAIWLSLAGPRLYRPLLGGMLTDGFKIMPAILFYVVYIAGVVFFAVRPALGQSAWTVAALHGAALGFVAYATYDLTNQATLRDWPIVITIADLCWGTALTCAAATLGFLVTRAFASQT